MVQAEEAIINVRFLFGSESKLKHNSNICFFKAVAEVVADMVRQAKADMEVKAMAQAHMANLQCRTIASVMLLPKSMITVTLSANVGMRRRLMVHHNRL